MKPTELLAEVTRLAAGCALGVRRSRDCAPQSHSVAPTIYPSAGVTIKRLEELAYEQTRLGELSLRRRLEPVTGTQVYEVKLGEEFLMSSLFTEAEVALTDLALARLAGTENLKVLVGGLGLGYTAVAALRHPAVAQLTVIEALEPVIAWHQEKLLPVSAELVEDRRTSLVAADFFALVAAGDDTVYDAVLLDIDHAPDFVLHESHQGFYFEEGLTRMREFLVPGGVFGLWSDNPPDPAFTDRVDAVFATVEAHVVSFANPLTQGTSTNTVYLASR